MLLAKKLINFQKSVDHNQRILNEQKAQKIFNFLEKKLGKFFQIEADVLRFIPWHSLLQNSSVNYDIVYKKLLESKCINII